MTAMIDLRKIIEEVLVPGIQDIRLRVTAIEAELKRTNDKMDNQSIQLNAKIDSQGDQLNARIDNSIGQLNARIDHHYEQLNTKIESQGNKIDSFREEFRSELRRLDQRIDSQGERFDSLEGRFSSLEKQIQLNREDFKLAISIHERLAAVEARLASH